MSMTDAILSRVARWLLKCPFDPELFDSAAEIQTHLLECHGDRICKRQRVLRQNADHDAERPVSLTICKYCEDEGSYYAIPRYEDRAPDDDMRAHIKQKHSPASGRPLLTSVRVPFLALNIAEEIAKFMDWQRWKDEFACCFGQCSERYDDPIHLLEHWMDRHVQAPTVEDVRHALESDPEEFQEKFPELLAAAMEEERDRTQTPSQIPDDGYRIRHMPPVPRVRSRPGEFIIYIEGTLSRIREDEYQEWMAIEGYDGCALTGGDWTEGHQQAAKIELRFCNIVDGFIPLVKEVCGILPPLNDGEIVEMSWQDAPETYFPCKFSGSKSKRAIYKLDGWLKRVFMDIPNGERCLPSGVRLYITRTGQRRYQLSLKWHPHLVRNCKFFVRDGAGRWSVEIRPEQVDWETGDDVFRHQLTFAEMDALHAEALNTNLSIRDAVHEVMSRYARIEPWHVRTVYEEVFLKLRTCSLAAVWAQFRPEHTCYVRDGDEKPVKYRFDPNGAFPEVRVLEPRVRNERVVNERAGGERAPASRLCIVVHWSKILNATRPDEKIAGGSAGAVQARFLGSLIHEFGPERILTLMRIVRSNSLSKYPERDFVNSRSRKVYDHQEVPGTDLFLCTKSDNQQKHRDILNLAQRLGFPQHVEVSVIPGMSITDWLNLLP